MPIFENRLLPFDFSGFTEITESMTVHHDYQFYYLRELNHFNIERAKELRIVFLYKNGSLTNDEMK